eukprot:TRINITY_DN6398_c0_g2_i2.p1 TRINITY_DN6398_c0_g2~~TRINITY_DN6398_c0_g2_i2.p1  ORF type:complete len:101 (+),score=4.17 TRINITY_DN6398_c0_g2_i2:869-1171(+)
MPVDQVHEFLDFQVFASFPFISSPPNFHQFSSQITILHPHSITNGLLIFQVGDSHPSIAKYLENRLRRRRFTHHSIHSIIHLQNSNQIDIQVMNYESKHV